MSPAAESTNKGFKVISEHNIYTALLGLTGLILAATAVMVGIYGLQMYGEIFTVSALP